MGVYWVRVFPGGVFGGSVTPKRWIVGVWGHKWREGKSALEVLRRPHARSLPRAGHRPPRELPTAGGGALAEFSLTCAWRRRRGSPRSWDSSRDATRTWFTSKHGHPHAPERDVLAEPVGRVPDGVLPAVIGGADVWSPWR